MATHTSCKIQTTLFYFIFKCRPLLLKKNLQTSIHQKYTTKLKIKTHPDIFIYLFIFIFKKSANPRFLQKYFTKLEDTNILI